MKVIYSMCTVSAILVRNSIRYSVSFGVFSDDFLAGEKHFLDEDILPCNGSGNMDRASYIFNNIIIKDIP